MLLFLECEQYLLLIFNTSSIHPNMTIKQSGKITHSIETNITIDHPYHGDLIITIEHTTDTKSPYVWKFAFTKWGQHLECLLWASEPRSSLDTVFALRPQFNSLRILSRSGKPVQTWIIQGLDKTKSPITCTSVIMFKHNFDVCV